MTLQLRNNEISDQKKDTIEPDYIFTFLRKDDITDQRITSSCRLILNNIKTLSVDEIFRVNSYRKYRDLLYNTVKTYAALTGWKPTQTHKMYI